MVRTQLSASPLDEDERAGGFVRLGAQKGRQIGWNATPRANTNSRPSPAADSMLPLLGSNRHREYRPIFTRIFTRMTLCIGPSSEGKATGLTVNVHRSDSIMHLAYVHVTANLNMHSFKWVVPWWPRTVSSACWVFSLSRLSRHALSSLPAQSSIWYGARRRPSPRPPSFARCLPLESKAAYPCEAN